MSVNAQHLGVARAWCSPGQQLHTYVVYIGGLEVRHGKISSEVEAGGHILRGEDDRLPRRSLGSPEAKQRRI
jgi:hypothetical protein